MCQGNPEEKSLLLPVSLPFAFLLSLLLFLMIGSCTLEAGYIFKDNLELTI